jgi:hypothetical protein
MTIAVRPRFRASLALLACLTIVAAACTPDGQGAPTPGATMADVPSSAVVPSSSSATASTPAATSSPPATPSPRPSATAAPSTPAPTTAPEAPAPARARKAFAMNLAQRVDFVAQYTFEWCVGASLQMAWNMSTDGSRTSRADQQRLWEMARDRSFSPFGGANPRGWVATLNELGIGPYVLVSLPTFDEAIRTAATAIRKTRRPVGLVMWRGRHAWMMSGFESTADPRHFDDFAVKRVRVHDPLYPHGSSVWGRSPKPNSLVSLATLGRQYVIRDRGRVNLGVPPGFLLVLPTTARS